MCTPLLLSFGLKPQYARWIGYLQFAKLHIFGDMAKKSPHTWCKGDNENTMYSMN